MLPEMLTKEQAASYLQISLSSIDRRVKEGKIAYYKISAKVIRFKKEDLDKFALASVLNKVSATHKDYADGLEAL